MRSLQLLAGITVAFLAIVNPLRASTIWTGPTNTYVQPAADPTQPANQLRLTPNVWLTRANSNPLFNAHGEDFYTSGISPTNTEWAVGDISNIGSLTFNSWQNVIGGVAHPPGPRAMVNVPLVLHLMAPDDIYLQFTITSWTRGPFDPSLSGFSVAYTTPAVAAPTPVISITNPAAGTVFAAPANVHLGANATVSSGTITNVTYFNSTTPLGSVTNAPFNFTASNLVAGSYALTAVATAAGVSGTSSVVNVSVVTPIAVSISSPQVTNGVFAFDYSANAGLKYVVQSSSNFTNWSSLVTNLAASNPVHFTNGVGQTGALFFRVGRLPNP